MARLPRNRRVKDFQRMVLQKRDIDIILAVYENRFLRRDQIERLFFGTASASNQRLQSLYQHKYLDRIYLPVDFGSSQAVYALDSVGAEVVAARLGVTKKQINWKRRQNHIENLFLKHTLAVSEIHVSLICDLRRYTDVKLLFWKREGLLPREKVHVDGKKYSLIPDAFFGLETPKGKSYYFVEADLGTTTLERFQNKIIAYREYWKSGGYQARYTYRNFRVLTVTKTRRITNLVQLAADVGSKNMFLFTVHDLASSKILSDIWYRPLPLDPISILD